MLSRDLKNYVSINTICTNGFFLMNLGWSIVYISGDHRLYFQNRNAFVSLKIGLVLANSFDPNVAFHPDLQCPFRDRGWG